MPPIERKPGIRKITFSGSTDSLPFAFGEGYALSIYSPNGGPTSLALKKESYDSDGNATGSFVVANDSSDSAITITLQADEWTNLNDEETKAVMGGVRKILVNGGSITKTLIADWST